MPKRKLDVSAAFAALSHSAKLPQDELVIIEPDPPKSNRGKFHYGASSRTINRTTEEIVLHNQHSIGCGGVSGDGADGTVQYFGPGRCIVPSELAATLLHQDQLTKAIDDRVFDTMQRFYHVMPMRSPVGMVYKGVRVQSLDFHSMFYAGDQFTI